MSRQLSLVMPYYRNPQMLQFQYAQWASYDDALKKRLQIVLVDDGSPNEMAANVVRPDDLPDLRIYYVLEDRLWHQHGARNLGAFQAEGKWLLLTDMDHMLPIESLREIFKRMDKLDPSHVYTLDRREATTGEYTLGRTGKHKPHPNSFLLTKDLYWKIGGYDEDYCGVYGTDGLFKSRAFTVGVQDHLDGVHLLRYWRNVIPDSSTRDVPRKEGRHPEEKKNVRQKKKERGEEGVVKVLQFEWIRVV
jgi:hypothetical protein